MDAVFTESQKSRLIELGVHKEELKQQFLHVKDREKMFAQMEREAVQANKQMLRKLMEDTHKPQLCKLQQELSDGLCGLGFTQVTTPVMISQKLLGKMSIIRGHPLEKQVYWVDSKTCLRPMLAPNLYEISRQLMNASKLPIRVFEIGSCFRKESEGQAHLKEFTMLNLVEWGTEPDNRLNRLKELANSVLEICAVSEYQLKEETSVVYGTGLDVVGKNGLELASTSMGPHPLDAAWKISCTWVGLGFGLERLLMYRENSQGIHRYSKSTSFLDGACLKIR